MKAPESPPSNLFSPLRPLSEAWLRAVRTPRERAVVGFVVLAVVAGMLVARKGTLGWRGAAAALIVGVVGLVLAARQREKRIWSDPARIIRRIAVPVDPDRAQRALRALSLVTRDGDTASGTSAPLARLHVERTIAALPSDRIVVGAARQALHFGIASGVFGAVVLALAIFRPWAILEGADVLVARRGVAPVSMQWLDDLQMVARPPEYLHLEEYHERAYEQVSLHRGTLVTFIGMPAHDGRRLFLTDGANEIPFADDGHHRLVARWPLGESVTLRVVARFGDVIIQEPDATEIVSIADRAPDVVLEGAPRKILLASEEVSEIPIRYTVSDDHGLREVHLVLRSGAREERRVLARLDGETRSDRGGHVLKTTDPFVKKSHAPVEVRVEAKDNDPVTGPKWGSSAAITLIPPEVGEPEARRIDSLRKLRDILVDTLGWRIGHEIPKAPADRKVYTRDLLKGADDSADFLEATLSGSYAGARVPSRLQAILRGQMRKVRLAVDAEVRAPNKAKHDATVKATERIVLVVDAVLRGLGQRDARETARQLADVAEELALGIAEMARHTDPAPGKVPSDRVDAAAEVLAGGGRSLVQLGTLGHDLGEIVGAYLLRVARARKEGDLHHAELAARDLAARLRQPDPSFGAKGRSGRAGGESGGGRGTEAGDPGDSPDDAEQAFNEAAQELERLAQDHAGGINNVEQALAGAGSDEEMKQMAEEAKKHAQAVREATKSLPTIGAGSDSWTSKGAAAREHGEQMARSLEHGNPADAVASGRNALQALEEAKRTAARERWSIFSPADNEAEKKIDEAQKKLEPEVKWAEQKLEAMRQRAAERAREQLSKEGDEEDKRAERAQKLGEKGRDQGVPPPALDSLDAAEKAAREAARALKRGEADKALERQREAQRMLEMAKEALGSNSGEGEREGQEGEPANDHADIPKADAHKGPEEFRRRVIKGLGQTGSGKNRDAVRRYAEGLLR
ncbi:DUF4175 domain-containing protein [Pendulispora rubella]|uniref:DUF4175 domain-containing protein n=1 Tax=Pendulispora rubella TaxID=2741070 RepID=A0ABZ2LHD1_9BACT